MAKNIEYYINVIIISKAFGRNWVQNTPNNGLRVHWVWEVVHTYISDGLLFRWYGMGGGDGGRLLGGDGYHLASEAWIESNK